MAQYFKKRPVISQSPSDGGTVNTDETSPKMNNTTETSEVKHTYHTFTQGTFSFHFLTTEFS